MKTIGKIDTQTLVLLGGGAIALYLFMKPKTTIYPTTYPTTTAQGYIAAQQAAAGNSTSSIIAAGGSALGSILNAISNF